MYDGRSLDKSEPGGSFFSNYYTIYSYDSVTIMVLNFRLIKALKGYLILLSARNVF